jgi:hypothetical protein
LLSSKGFNADNDSGVVGEENAGQGAEKQKKLMKQLTDHMGRSDLDDMVVEWTSTKNEADVDRKQRQVERDNVITLIEGFLSATADNDS